MMRVWNKIDEERRAEDVRSKRSSSYFVTLLSVLVAPLQRRERPVVRRKRRNPPRFHLYLGGHLRIRERQPLHGPENGNCQAREAGVV